MCLYKTNCSPPALSSTLPPTTFQYDAASASTRELRGWCRSASWDTLRASSARLSLSSSTAHFSFSTAGAGAEARGRRSSGTLGAWHAPGVPDERRVLACDTPRLNSSRARSVFCTSLRSSCPYSCQTEADAETLSPGNVRAGALATWATVLFSRHPPHHQNQHLSLVQPRPSQSPASSTSSSSSPHQPRSSWNPSRVP
ncbi:unnamed protein product [Chondrus crispus]|uniref:Uncharacterized protein n=1 Tax=Chondrus crispus TaxID=2769 RepID=R7Q615_CHOCR|nr:unnamed protein product [Chondrus crispus]CDF33957.1 unnamed protein product [Chondrus crispus]|eukprot:XP_005713776.1 unnamed protein product [Chondrus crispus]